MDIIPQLIVNSIIAGAIYTMVALGFNLIYGTVKFFDLGYGALTAVWWLCRVLWLQNAWLAALGCRAAWNAGLGFDRLGNI